MQSVSSRIWTRIVVSNSYDDNYYTTGTSWGLSLMNFDTWTHQRWPTSKHLYTSVLWEHCMWSRGTAGVERESQGTPYHQYDLMMRIYIVSWPTIVENDPKVHFSLAAIQRCRGGRYTFPWIAPPIPFDPYHIMLSLK